VKIYIICWLYYSDWLWVCEDAVVQSWNSYWFSRGCTSVSSICRPKSWSSR